MSKKKILADIPRQDQADNECPQLPGYQFPDKTQQNNLRPDPVVPQQKITELPRLPGSPDDTSPTPNDLDDAPSDSADDPTQAIGTEPFAGASSVSTTAERVNLKTGPGEGNMSNPMDENPGDDEQELNELYDASRADNNIGSPGSTTSGTPSLSEHASTPTLKPTPDLEYPELGPEGAGAGDAGDPLVPPVDEEDLLLLGSEDDEDPEEGALQIPEESDTGQESQDFEQSLTPENGAIPGVKKGGKNRSVRALGLDDISRGMGVGNQIVPDMRPQNGESMQTPLGVDGSLLRDPYANKLNKESKESKDTGVEACGDQLEYYQEHGFPDEVDSSLETPEEGEQLLDPDSTEWHTEINSDGELEEDPYTYDLGESEDNTSEVSAEGAGEGDDDTDSTSDIGETSDIQGLTPKEKGQLFQSLSAPGAGITSSVGMETNLEIVQAKIRSGYNSSSAKSTGSVYKGSPVLGEDRSRDRTSTGIGKTDSKDSESTPDAEEERKSRIQRVNAKAWSIMVKTVLKFTRGRALIDEQEGAITFSTDVNFLAFVAALGMANLKMRPYKPSQVVRQGTDSVFQVILDTGARLQFNVDRRGFLDKINLDV
jgi:hypothetical protein